MGQQHRRDAYVIVDQLPLGEAGFRVEHLVQIRQLELASLDFDGSGSLGHVCTPEMLDATTGLAAPKSRLHNVSASQRFSFTTCSIEDAIQPRVPTKEENQLPISSSKPPEFAPEQEQLFREVLTLLNASGVRYVISGAFALREHTGICRDTKDLDVFMPPENVGEAMAFLQQHGFQCEVADPVWLAKAHRGDFFVDLITGMSTGTVTVNQSWIERATPAEIFGIPVKVLGP